MPKPETVVDALSHLASELQKEVEQRAENSARDAIALIEEVSTSKMRADVINWYNSTIKRREDIIVR
jgi:hypothetical protein